MKVDGPPKACKGGKPAVEISTPPKESPEPKCAQEDPYSGGISTPSEKPPGGAFLCIAAVAAALVTSAAVMISSPARADVVDLSKAIQPPFLDPAESRTIFRNPADLTYFDNVFGGTVTYSPHDQRFTGSVILRTPDFGLGNLSVGVDYFGANFGENIVYTPTPDGAGQYTLTRGGYRQAFTWAKNAGWFRIGAGLKNYQYRELDTGRHEEAVGLNAGLYYTGLGDIILGLTTTDISGTAVRDAAGQTLRTIPNRTWLTGAVIGHDGLVLSAGIAADLIDRSRGTTGILRSTSFRARKLFNESVIFEGGYNSKDLYGKIGYRINGFLGMDYTISNDLTVKDGVTRHLFSFSYAIPDGHAPTLAKLFLLAPHAVTAPLAPKRLGRPFNPWLDSPWWLFGFEEPFFDIEWRPRRVPLDSLKSTTSAMLSPEGRLDTAAKGAAGPGPTLMIRDRLQNARRILTTLQTLDPEDAQPL